MLSNCGPHPAFDSVSSSVSSSARFWILFRYTYNVLLVFLASFKIGRDAIDFLGIDELRLLLQTYMAKLIVRCLRGEPKGSHYTLFHSKSERSKGLRTEQAHANRLKVQSHSSLCALGWISQQMRMHGKTANATRLAVSGPRFKIYAQGAPEINLRGFTQKQSKTIC